MKNRLTQNELLYLAVDMSILLALPFEERLITDLRRKYINMYKTINKSLTGVN